ncbi:sodium:solute symporter family protein [Ruficoccus amylovorans]|uniref:Sodium:solute symporter family protein n=1 Tax=Ruficoccus amylovorans TaxID=1804625 RepID=A0A842HJ16_9BACT|nr:sodium:solute symporter family protein [Ruficoccus amylovorans]MBC2595576.1 sodium:solute symporter family protein [Ruficoccus amylovorans]
MNLSILDWIIVGGFLAFLFGMAFMAHRYTRSVSDFLAASRSAGRYLLTMADGMSSMGAIAVIASFEKFYQAGFAASWWGQMMAPLAMVAALSGWVSYRYRETRAMTMAQFFEMRYSRRFRVYAGILAWVSGILNYGVFPGITALFLIHFCGLPETFQLLGTTFSTFPFIMAVMLSIAVCFTLFGGMIAVMITDFFQAQFVNIVFLSIMGLLLWKISWSDIVSTLETAPAGKSMLNPFDQGEIKDFNFWFFMIFGFKIFYNRLGWQGSQGYNCAAKSPHEQKMAGVLAEWRNGVNYLMFLLMPVCAYVIMHNIDFASVAGAVQGTLGQIGDEQTRSQMLTPIVMSNLFPVGVIGLFAAAMLAAAISTDDTQLHSWGSIFIQDVVLPFRNKPFTPKQQIVLLRCSVIGVAIFAFFWSWLFPLRDYLLMYFLLTGTIYLGGSGAVIIGGLYWRRATTQGAWAAMTIGLLVGAAGITLQTVWPSVPALTNLAPAFPINGAWLAMIAYISSIIGFVVVSLLTCKQPFNLEKMLHRGKYALPDSRQKGDGHQTGKTLWGRLFGFSDEFTRGDRVIYRLKIGWTMFWFTTFVVGTIVGLTVGIPDGVWGRWWLFTVVLSGIVGVITVVWFLIGGMRDLWDLLRILREVKRDDSDDGSVHEFDEHRDDHDVPPDTPVTRPSSVSTAPVIGK